MTAENTSTFYTTSSPSIVEEEFLLFPSVDKKDGDDVKEDVHYMMDDKKDGRSDCNNIDITDGNDGNNSESKDIDDDNNGDDVRNGDDKGVDEEVAESNDNIISITKETTIQRRSSTRTKERYDIFICVIICIFI